MKSTSCTKRYSFGRLILLLFLDLCLRIQTLNAATYIEQVADAVYWAEGGKLSKRPYGLVSYSFNSPASYRARCIYHLTTYYNLWNKRGDFIDYLAEHWAPTKGVSGRTAAMNRNWKKNVKYFLKNPKSVA